MRDITAIFITSNAVPDAWADYHKQVLLEALDGIPIITVSRKPMDLGINILDTDEPGTANYYRQFLRGAELATTDFVAVIEDDTLYSREHFRSFRPPLNSFGYNLNRWSIATWGKPIYSRKERGVGAAGIYPRLELIESFREKVNALPKTGGFDVKVPCGEPGTGGEKDLKITRRTSVTFYSKIPIIQFNHDYFTNADSSPEGVERRHHKGFGIVKAYDIPFWGKASNLVKYFK